MSVPPDERLPRQRVLSHLGVMAAVAVVLGVVVAGLAIPFAGVVGLAARDVARGMDNLPTELETEALPQKTRIIDANGNVIAAIYDENRINVPLSQISRTMVKAIVSIEDSRFYEHGALDLKGTLRALITNQASEATVQGGSSITQQMVKLTLVSQANTKAEREAAIDDTYARKIRELRYAIAFEENHTKDWILEQYLNLAYFGDGAFGVQAAARHYFNKNAKDLDLRESALLAGLVKNPTGYDPTNSPIEAKRRRDVVLDRMAELNVVPRQRAAKVKKRDLGLDVQPAQNGCVFSRAPFFCDYVVNVLMQDESLGKTSEERKKLIRSGGLTIRTTIDLRYQAAADQSVRSHVFPTDEALGGLAMVEPGTGDVKAIAQSRPMGRDKSKGQTYLNYVVPTKYGDSSGFQAGSTFKAFVLATALKKGIDPHTTLTVPSHEFIPMNDYRTCDGPYTSTAIWDPQNFDGSAGTFDLYTGTQHSVNTFFANLELLTGLCEPYQLAKSMGIDLTDPERERVPSFTLGVVNTSPLEMAEAYATFAAQGKHCASRAITAIEDSAGNLLKQYPTQCTQVLDANVANTVNDILKGVMEPGGFGSAISTDQPDAGKTGTTQDGKSVWFVGYTPNLATAAMIAGANQLGQPIPLAGQTVGGSFIATATGSGIAGPMWGDAMGVIEQWLDDATFTPPSLEQLEGEPASVPDTYGMSISEATQTIENAGFVVLTAGDQVPSNYPAGTVAYTSPGADDVASKGDVVTIYPSLGYVPAPPPPPAPPSGGGGGGNGGGGDGGGGGGGGGGGTTKPGNGNGGGTTKPGNGNGRG
ncbi:MAG TPA: transglycosylase domain-containing protein [Nocardioides sp.]|nr:transglycosylase domain-containing protein [Nocardioides sp.]